MPAFKGQLTAEADQRRHGLRDEARSRTRTSSHDSTGARSALRAPGSGRARCSTVPCAHAGRAPRARRRRQALRRARALDGFDLRVAQGEVFGFLGPNGAGKTDGDPDRARAPAPRRRMSRCSAAIRGADGVARSRPPRLPAERPASTTACAARAARSPRARLSGGRRGVVRVRSTARALARGSCPPDARVLPRRCARSSASSRPCSTTPSCSCSTSRPRDSTRSCRRAFYELVRERRDAGRDDALLVARAERGRGALRARRHDPPRSHDHGARARRAAGRATAARAHRVRRTRPRPRFELDGAVRRELDGTRSRLSSSTRGATALGARARAPNASSTSRSRRPRSRTSSSALSRRRAALAGGRTPRSAHRHEPLHLAADRLGAARPAAPDPCVRIRLGLPARDRCSDTSARGAEPRSAAGADRAAAARHRCARRVGHGRPGASAVSAPPRSSWSGEACAPSQASSRAGRSSSC